MPKHLTPLDHLQRRSCALALLAVMALLLTLGGRLAYIETVMGERLVRMAVRQHDGRSVIPARRGLVFDARGRVLALSHQTPDVFVDPSLVKDVDALSDELSPRINRDAPELAEDIRKRDHLRYVRVARDVDTITADAVLALGDVAVGLTQSSRRSYPLGGSMSQLLGWVGTDGVGLGGVELEFDEHLRGRDGRWATVRDARRRALQRADHASVPPIDGGHVVLTIDAEIQRIAELALQHSVEKFEAQSGVTIVMSPKDGSILAMASWPTVDLNEPFSAETADFRRNRAITDPVEPGSTIKPILASVALERGFVTREELIDCGNTGFHYFGRRRIEDTKPNGLLDLRGIITNSSNIGMDIIGVRMGNEVLYDTLRRFGLGQSTGIECPGESGGSVHPLDSWTSYSTTSVPIGYELLVTPLQLVSAHAALHNDGVLLKPHLVKRLLAPDGAVIMSFEKPEIVRRVVSKDVARYITRDLLVSVVEHGGGGGAKVGPYRVMGKTGTAKLLSDDRSGYASGAYLGLFVGAAPVSDPQMVVVAMIRRPNPALGYYGGKVAAPVAGEIFASGLAYLGVVPDDSPNLAGL